MNNRNPQGTDNVTKIKEPWVYLVRHTVCQKYDIILGSQCQKYDIILGSQCQKYDIFLGSLRYKDHHWLHQRLSSWQTSGAASDIIWGSHGNLYNSILCHIWISSQREFCPTNNCQSVEDYLSKKSTCWLFNCNYRHRHLFTAVHSSSYDQIRNTLRIMHTLQFCSVSLGYGICWVCPSHTGLPNWNWGKHIIAPVSVKKHTCWITGPLWGESTGHHWIPLTKGPVIQSFDVFFNVEQLPIIWDTVNCDARVTSLKW